MTGSRGRRTYRAGIIVAAVTFFLTVWTTIVRDDGSAAAYFMIILAVAVGWFSAGFQSSGMVRTMIGAGAMQLLLGALVATAPVTAAVPGGPTNAIVFNVAFAALWLLSAALFRSAARNEAEPVRAR